MARPPPWGCALAALLLCLVHSSAGQPAWVQRRPPLPWRRSAVQLPQPTVPLLEPPALPAEVPQPVKEPVQPAPEPAQPAPEAVPPVPVTEPAAVPPAVGAGNPPPACSLLDVLWPAPNTTFFIQALEATQLTGLLADPLLQATVFVPTDRAWASLLRVLRRSRDQLLADRDALVLVLRNHIAPGRAYSIEELKQLPYLERLPTLAGQPLMVYTEAGQGLKVAATSRQIAFVLDKGLAGAPCADLVVAAHAVDAVLLPDPDWQDDLPAVTAFGAAG